MKWSCIPAVHVVHIVDFKTEALLLIEKSGKILFPLNTSINNDILDKISDFSATCFLFYHYTKPILIFTKLSLVWPKVTFWRHYSCNELWTNLWPIPLWLYVHTHIHTPVHCVQQLLCQMDGCGGGDWLS